MRCNAQVSDRALIHRVLDGDPDGAELFVARFTRLVWWILTHQVRLARETAEEVYQDVFVHLWEDDYRRLRLWSGEGDFASYLAPIVRRRGLDRLRKEDALREQTLPGAEEPGGQWPEDQPSPEELVWIDQQRSRLECALSALGERDRRLYELRFVEGHSYREVAAVLGITVNNVGVRVNRLVGRLQQALAGQEPPAPTGVTSAVRSPAPGPSYE